MTQYAIHLPDVAALGDVHPLLWLLRAFLTEETVNLNSKFDGVGVIVEPDAAGLDWDAAMTIAMSQPLPSGWPLRIYRRGRGGWQRVQPDATPPPP